MYNTFLTPSLTITGLPSTGFQLDGTGSSEDIFVPSTKINQELTQWAVTYGGAPDKGDIVNVMGAVGVHPQTLTETVAYLGMSRTDNSGSTSYGYWLLQHSVVISGGQLYISGTNTLATHTVNDVLVLSDFTNGGDVARIQIFRWNGTTTVPVYDLNGVNIADCRNAAADPIGCGRSNTGPITVTWPYYNKGVPGYTDTIPAGQFFEAGLNLSRLLQGFQGCYSSLVAFSSASFSDSSTLKDTVFSNLQTCGHINIDKMADPQSKETDVITYTVVITNDGPTLMHLLTLSDTLLGNLTNVLTTSTSCGTLDPLEACQFSYPYTVPVGAFTSMNPITNVAIAVYAPPSGAQYSQTIGSDVLVVELFKPGVIVTKTGPSVALPGETVIYTFTVQNVSSVAPSATITTAPSLVFTTSVPAFGTLTGGSYDTVLGNLTAAATAAGCDLLEFGEICTFTYSTTYPGTGALTNTVFFTYHPLAFPNTITGTASHVVDFLTATPTPTASPSPTSTDTPTVTPTATPTNTPTATPTDTPTATPTNTPTNTPTDTPTATPTDTPTNTPTATPTNTPTNTPTDTPTATPTDTPTNTPTATPTDTPTNTPTATPTDTPTATPTDTPTATPTDTPTNTPTATPTDTPTDTPTATPTDTPTATPTDTPTATPTDTPTATPTDTPTATPTDTPTTTPTATPTDTPTNTPTATPTDTPTATPTDTPTATPTDTPTATPTDTPTATPTDTP
ncbi:MAG: hypothetical protein K1X39_08040, partial [Thermoflexales bacterium]|nr:hypothetical protein [Thermoflexales bacterium]